MLESLREPPARRSLPPHTAHALRAMAGEPLDALLARLHSGPQGLDEATAARVLRRAGPNDVHRERPIPGWLHLWHCYRNPFSLLLTVLAGISWWTADPTSAVVIVGIVLLATALRFVQESRSHRAADAMKQLVVNTATVLRDGAQRELPIRALVPGDVVLLSAGDMVPADLRLISAKDLFVGQSALTGESLPVEKFANPAEAPAANPLAIGNVVFMGTNVVSGAATAVVLATGARSVFGALAEALGQTAEPVTAFQAGINSVSWLLIRFMLVMVPAVLLINGLSKGDWLQAALFALSVAVGLTPELLPMIVTSTLAKGAVALARRKVVVKRLDAVQHFGAMDVLCTDKTGTLTQDRIVLARHLAADGAESAEVIEYAFLNSHYQTGLKNLLDKAVLEHVELHQRLDVSNAWRKLDEIPFDFTRRRMSVVVAREDGPALLICKGALDEVLGACTQVRERGRTLALDGVTLDAVRAVAARMNDDGLRVVAVAVREFAEPREAFGVADESALTLVGYIAFLDPPKDSTGNALRSLAAQGIAVKILTGDNDGVALKVCRDVGLAVDGVLLGDDVETMDDALLAQRALACTLFARLTPAHKERLVRALRSQGRVVGYLGDGINDAPALRAADVGISVDTAVDIAKEAADVILLEKSLMVLSEGVAQGRRTFANMLKYIRTTAASNFGNVFSVLFASIALPFLPMLPMQLLTQNLLYDISQSGVPFDAVDEEATVRPQHWDPADIRRSMLWFGPLSSLFDLATFAVLWYGFAAHGPGGEALFRTGWFVEGLCSQVLVVQVLRTRRLPFVGSRPGAVLAATSLGAIVLALLLVASPLAPLLGFVALPAAYFAALAALLCGYLLLAQWLKGRYAARYGWR